MLRTKRKRFEEDEDAESMNERRSDNERRDNEKLFELLESTHLVVRDKRGRTHISQILDELVKRMSDIKNDNEGNDWLPEITIPFPVVTEEDELLPEYSFREITLSAPFKDMEDGVRTPVSSLGTSTTNTNDNDRLKSIRIRQEMPGNDIMRCFGLVISPSLNIPSQLCIGRAKMPFVTPLISQLNLSFDNNEFVPRRDFLGNPLLACATEFYSSIWSNQKLSDAETLICDQIRNLKKTPVPVLRDFESHEVCELAYVDWQFQMNSYLNVMTMYCSEIITLPLPFSKNEGGVDLMRKFPMHSAIVMMDNALINVYQDAISKNSIIQAQLPHRLSINSVNELVQAIEGIFLSQSPDAIAHRQSLFHKLTQNENEDTSALMNRIMLYLRMFEYTLRPKDLVDLIGCMYLTFKNRSLYVQAKDKYLTHAKNNTLDFGVLLRNISETEKAMKEIGGDMMRPFQDEQLFYMEYTARKCRICKNPGHLASRCNMRKNIQSSAGQRGNNPSETSQKANIARQPLSQYENKQFSYGNQANSNVPSNENRESSSRGGYRRRGRYSWKNQNLRYAAVQTSRGGGNQQQPSRGSYGGERNNSSRGGRGASWNHDRYDGYRQRQNNGNYYGNSRNVSPFNPSNQQANMACMNDESDIFHDDTVSMHEHAAVLCFSDPPNSGETNPVVEVDVDEDTSNDDEPVSGPMSVSWSVSVTTSIEPVSTSVEPSSLPPVIQCFDPPISECAIELNSSCSYFMYPIANSTSLEEETMRYMCGKYHFF